MQSSAMNAEKLRLRAASHAVRLRRSGERGALPTRASRSVAVDKAEAADPGLGLAFAPAPEDQPRRRPDSACGEKADAERGDRGGREISPQFAADVRRLADAFAKRLRGARELLPLRLDVAADVLERARVPTGHPSSGPPSSASLRGWPARGRGAFQT